MPLFLRVRLTMYDHTICLRAGLLLLKLKATCMTLCYKPICWFEPTLGLKHRCEGGESTPGCALKKPRQRLVQIKPGCPPPTFPCSPPLMLTTTVTVTATWSPLQMLLSAGAFPYLCSCLPAAFSCIATSHSTETSGSMNCLEPLFPALHACPPAAFLTLLQGTSVIH
jgi:hypothetical protein